ncbi:hypothetical protein KXD96_11970 [Mycobacterium sp. SMC-2]|uniref:hypothetical protein n=1 Tax=Mycobacterium sp. SMC-2 TaxID=2857058 RepID=UPI0021B4159B|nr:hypothetical protein [Mycobacterium sp. SMC-2]UXA08716.1 hypothetical protein KXD96_11970 [Mycobacterium sp. SMC-2]
MFAALSLFAAAFGFWAVQVGTAAGAPQPAAAGPLQLRDGSAPHSHSDFGSTLNDDKAFKSAGLKRDRPTTFWLSVPRSSWTPSSLASVIGAQRPIDACTPRAPSTVVTGQDLLTKLCVSRR